MNPTPPNPGKRSVHIQGSANGTVIVTGEGNQINLTRHPQDGPFFHLLDAAFRERQGQRQPADFYNGTRPNWANIAREHDARRELLK